MLFSFGMGLDFFNLGNIDCLRTGIKYRGLQLGFIRPEPYFFINTTKSMDYKGLSTGLNIVFQKDKPYFIRVNIGYSYNDIIENTVKGKADGFEVRMDFGSRF